MTWRDTKDFAGTDSSALARFVYGMVRRMAVQLTDSTLWRLIGQRGGVAGDETIDLEIFPGIGFYARPTTSGNPEAITASYGSSRTTAIVATRDEATRQAVAGNLQPDESMVYTSQAVVYIKSNGTVEIRSASGAAVQLALKSDVQSLVTSFNTHTHPVPGVTLGPATTNSSVPAVAASSPVGTTILKGE